MNRQTGGETPQQLTLYIPKKLRQKRLLERLRRLAQQHRRSMNFLALEALAKFLEEVERRAKPE